MLRIDSSAFDFRLRQGRGFGRRSSLVFAAGPEYATHRDLRTTMLVQLPVTLTLASSGYSRFHVSATSNYIGAADPSAGRTVTLLQLLRRVRKEYSLHAL
jgi:hypothetical protein